MRATTVSQDQYNSDSSILLCQDILGHRTHASLLEEFVRKDDDWTADVIRFSVNQFNPVTRTAFKALQAQIPWSFVRRHNLDGFSTRAMLVQSFIAGRALRALRPSTVYIHGHTAGLASRRLPMGTGVLLSLDGTSIASLRMDGRESTNALDRTRIALEHAAFDRADLIISFSDWARESLINDYGLPAEKTITIRNGSLPITPRDGNCRFEPWNPANDLPIIGFVGRQFTRKGGDILLEAHQRYLSTKCQLAIVTSQSIDTRGLRNVHVLEPMPRAKLLHSVLPRFAVYVHPAQKDWSPFAVIEALAAGLPIVSSSVGALPEMIKDGTNGVVLNRLTAKELAESIEMILDNTRMAASMGVASEHQFAKYYDARNNYPELLRAIRSIAR